MRRPVSPFAYFGLVLALLLGIVLGAQYLGKLDARRAAQRPGQQGSSPVFWEKTQGATAPTALDFNDKGDRLLVGYADGRVVAFDREGQMATDWPSLPGAIVSVVALPEPLVLLKNGQAFRWSNANDRFERITGFDQVTAIGGREKFFAVAGHTNKRVRLLIQRQKGQTSVRTLSGTTVESLVVSPERLSVLLGCSDGSVREVDDSGQAIITFTRGLTTGVKLLTTSPDGFLIFGWGQQTTGQLWDREQLRLKTVLRSRNPLVGLTIAPGTNRGLYPVAICSRKGVMMLTIETLELGFMAPDLESSYVELSDQPASAVAWSPDGELLVAAGPAGIQTWEFPSRKEESLEAR